MSRVRDGSTGVGSFRYVSFTFVRLVKRLLAALPHLATLALQAAGALLLPLSTHRCSCVCCGSRYAMGSRRLSAFIAGRFFALEEARFWRVPLRGFAKKSRYSASFFPSSLWKRQDSTQRQLIQIRKFMERAPAETFCRHSNLFSISGEVHGDIIRLQRRS